MCLCHLLLLLSSIHAFIPTHYRNSRLNYQTLPTDEASTNTIAPPWVPMELIEVLASEQAMLTKEFVKAYVDGEAYTSCDDEGDGLHECGKLFKLVIAPFHL